MKQYFPLLPRTIPLLLALILLLAGAAPRPPDPQFAALHQADLLLAAGDFSAARTLLEGKGRPSSPLIHTALMRLDRYDRLAAAALSLAAVPAARLRARLLADMDGDGEDDYLCLLEEPCGDFRRQFRAPILVVWHSLDDFRRPLIRDFPDEGPFVSHEWVTAELNRAPGRELLLRFNAADDREHRLLVMAHSPSRGAPEVLLYTATTAPPRGQTHARDLQNTGYYEIIHWEAWPDRDSPCRLPVVHSWQDGELKTGVAGYSRFYREALHQLEFLPRDSLDRLQGEAMLLERADRRDEAERRYRRILAQIPADALHGPLIARIRQTAENNRRQMHREWRERTEAPRFP